MSAAVVRFGRPTRVMLAGFSICLIVGTVVIASIDVVRSHPGDDDALGYYGLDFGGMYTAGQLLNEYGPDRLYDFNLQQQIYENFLGLPGTTKRLPFAHPPTFAFLLGQLARLPFPIAYVVWMAVTLALYLAGLAVLARLAPPAFARWRNLAILLALAFPPFLIYTWYNGQVSAIGFLAFCLMLAAWLGDRPFLAGLALALTLYKPTLALPWLPLLLLGRQWKMLAGFAVGAVGWLLLGIALAGPGCWLGYWHGMQRHRANMDGDVYRLPAAVFTDTFALANLWQLPPRAQKVVGALLAAGPYLLLAGAWWRWPKLDERPRRWLLAATFVWSMVLNLYCPRSDTLPVVIAAFLLVAWPPQAPAPGAAMRSLLGWLLVAVLLTSPMSQFVANATRVPLYTLALVGLGSYALWFVYRRPVTV